MIKTLSDYNLLESEEWKDSINTLFLELRSKLPEFFKEVPYLRFLMRITWKLSYLLPNRL
jgi:hypothetical protein